ncbi:MAG: hypothetical protein AB9891_05505 [Anaerolineaceae bacterium]
MTALINKKPSHPWLMLISRTVLFAVVQSLFALAFLASGSPSAWHESERWWIFCAAGANIISILLLNWLFKRESGRFLDLFRFQRETFWKDLGLVLLAFVVAGPIAYFPMNFLGDLILGSAARSTDFLFRPLPGWALVAGLLFPLTITLAELPTYFGYVMPRLAEKLKNGWMAWAIASFFLGLQHAALPLIFDGPYLLWRALMYMPFAFYIGLVVKLRPRLMPFLVIGHGLIDLMTLSVYLIPR